MKLTNKEQKTISHLKDILISEFNIPVCDVSIEMRRDVPVFSGGLERTIDQIDVKIEKNADENGDRYYVDDKGEILSPMPVQHKLSDALNDVWNAKTLNPLSFLSYKEAPLVSVDLPMLKEASRKNAVNDAQAHDSLVIDRFDFGNG